MVGAMGEKRGVSIGFAFYLGKRGERKRKN